MDFKGKEGWTYAAAGVDLDQASAAVKLIRGYAERTRRPEVLGGIGAFAGFFCLPPGRFREAVLVSATDGVGTKLKVAFLMDKHDTVGRDLVAMCVNDILVHGAEPLFFLDYVAVGQLDVRRVGEVVRGVAEGCREAGCALVGGETAEMPGFYAAGEYDLAGFAVGAVERELLVDGSRIRPGDVLVGLASSGLHANGFSLVRRILLQEKGMRVTHYLEECRRSVGEELLEPTRIYVRPVLSLLPELPVHGLAHITGGGIPENLGRVMPPGTRAVVTPGTWPVPPIFEVVREAGHIQPAEMYRTFNMGVGLILVVPAGAAAAVRARLAAAGERCYVIGEVVAAAGTGDDSPEGDGPAVRVTLNA